MRAFLKCYNFNEDKIVNPENERLILTVFGNFTFSIIVFKLCIDLMISILPLVCKGNTINNFDSDSESKSPIQKVNIP